MPTKASTVPGVNPREPPASSRRCPGMPLTAERVGPPVLRAPAGVGALAGELGDGAAHTGGVPRAAEPSYTVGGNAN